MLNITNIYTHEAINNKSTNKQTNLQKKPHTTTSKLLQRTGYKQVKLFPGTIFSEQAVSDGQLDNQN